MSAADNARGRGRPPGVSSRDDRRRELLAAACEIVRRDGSDASMSAIAEAAGVTKPILYNHFADKSGLLGAVAHEIGDDLIGRLDAALAGEDGPQDLLERAVAMFVSFVETEPNAFAVVFGAHNSEEALLLDSAGHRIAAVLGERLVAAGVSVDGEAAKIQAFAILGAVLFATGLWVHAHPISRDVFVEKLTDHIWNGLGAAFEPVAVDPPDE